MTKWQPPQPPTVNGIAELTEEEILEIKHCLKVCEEEFEPSEDEPVLSLHGLVSRYNDKYPDKPINGDTAQYIQSYVTEDEEEGA